MPLSLRPRRWRMSSNHCGPTARPNSCNRIGAFGTVTYPKHKALLLVCPAFSLGGGPDRRLTQFIQNRRRIRCKRHWDGILRRVGNPPAEGWQPGWQPAGRGLACRRTDGAQPTFESGGLLIRLSNLAGNAANVGLAR